MKPDLIQIVEIAAWACEFCLFLAGFSHFRRLQGFNRTAERHLRSDTAQNWQTSKDPILARIRPIVDSVLPGTILDRRMISEQLADSLLDRGEEVREYSGIIILAALCATFIELHLSIKGGPDSALALVGVNWPGIFGAGVLIWLSLKIPDLNRGMLDLYEKWFATEIYPRYSQHGPTDLAGSTAQLASVIADLKQSLIPVQTLPDVLSQFSADFAEKIGPAIVKNIRLTPESLSAIGDIMAKQIETLEIALTSHFAAMLLETEASERRVTEIAAAVTGSVKPLNELASATVRVASVAPDFAAAIDKSAVLAAHAVSLLTSLNSTGELLANRFTAFHAVAESAKGELARNTRRVESLQTSHDAIADKLAKTNTALAAIASGFGTTASSVTGASDRLAKAAAALADSGAKIEGTNRENTHEIKRQNQLLSDMRREIPHTWFDLFKKGKGGK